MRNKEYIYLTSQSAENCREMATENATENEMVEWRQQLNGHEFE